MKNIGENVSKSFSGTGFLYGYGFFLAAWKWYDIVLHGYFKTDVPSLFFQVFFSLGLFISAATCFLILSRKTTLLSSKPYTRAVAASLLILSLVAVLIYLGRWPFSQGITALVGLVRGVAIGGSVLLWIERFGFVSVIKAIAGLSAAYLVCLIVFFYLLNMTELFTGITALVLPVLSQGFLFLSQPKTDPASRAEASFMPMRASKSVEVLTWVVLVSVIYQIAQNYGIENSAALEYFQIGSLIPIGLIIAFLFFFPRRVGFQNMYRISLALLTAGLIVFIFAKHVNIAGQTLVGSAYFAVSITMLIVAASYASLSKTSAAQGYAYVIIANAIGGLLAVIIPATLSHFGISLHDENTTFLMLAIVLLLLVPYALRKESNLYTHFSTVDSALESDIEGSAEATLCETVGKEHRLTKREISILLLHVEGHTQADIAEKLFIAEGTVRAHYGNIYKKLSVRSREELSQVLAEYKA
jgi:DNA-binding CsgD family transcriptional regulator